MNFKGSCIDRSLFMDIQLGSSDSELFLKNYNDTVFIFHCESNVALCVHYYCFTSIYSTKSSPAIGRVLLFFYNVFSYRDVYTNSYSNLQNVLNLFACVFHCYMIKCHLLYPDTEQFILMLNLRILLSLQADQL